MYMLRDDTAREILVLTIFYLGHRGLPFVNVINV